MKDEVLDELRKIKLKLEKRMLSNPKKFAEDMKKIEQENKHRLLVGKPRFKKPKAA